MRLILRATAGLMATAAALLLALGMISGLDRTLDRCTVEPGAVVIQLAAGVAVVALAALAVSAHRWPDRAVRNIAAILAVAAYLGWAFIRVAAYSC